eukprot:MONOS_12931.1-p1 / transcript=MONOS_12931.1 / gene=MONOS_12931 / organism=Monocercomonoides_exilis_PA203 / gene_product=Zinc finger CCCH domain-containing protein / transcript_product=Zinc finger CCCH domain-containing protein / location=Mono_scaffold00754:26626-27962(-) / protein_length=296 / sequence_SO=supercontig / SO=protein_coding / is_pseudo=false
MFKKKSKSSQLKPHIDDDPVKEIKEYEETLEKPIKITSQGLAISSNSIKKVNADKIIPRHEVNDSTGAAIDDSGRTCEIDDPNRTNKRPMFGPVKASSHIRVTSYFDYQPDICKDWFETGFCIFGDACKFMHTREDFKTGWQIEKDWEAQKKSEEALLHRMKSGLSGEEADDDLQDTEEELDGIPFACFICRKRFKNPVVTNCKHYFCEACALQHYAKDGRCAACGKPTHGIFNAALELMTEKSQKWLDKVWKKKSRKEEPNEIIKENEVEAGDSNEQVQEKPTKRKRGETDEEIP